MKTYGSVSHEPDHRAWIIETDPNVAIRLKRVFAKIDTGSFGRHRLSDNVENCRDLEWFLVRFPMVLSEDNRAHLTRQAAEHKDQQSIAQQLLDGRIPAPNLPLALPLRKYQLEAVAVLLKMRRLLLGDDMGLGKLQAVDTSVLTPSGYRPIGNLVVGDRVIGSDGTPTRVSGVFPQGIRPSYRITFSDGAAVEAGPEHLWRVLYWRGGRSLAALTVTTEQIRTGTEVKTQHPSGARRMSLQRTRLMIPMLSGPTRFDDDGGRPVPPYALGMLLANGSLAQNSISVTTNSADWPEVAERFGASGVAIGSVNRYGNATRAGLPGLMQIIRGLELNVLSGEKRIPSAYMRAPAEERIALLQGLMDGDGSCSATRNRVTYHSVALGLAKDVRELVECLGGAATVRTYDRTDEGKPVEYQVRIRLPSSVPPFHVARKRLRYQPVSRMEPTRSIVSVEYVRDVESVCISVAAEDHLYATEHAILTHNTVTAIGLFTEPKALPALVVTLPAVQIQWQQEIARFAPHLRTTILKKGTPYAFNRKDAGKRAGQRALPGGMPDIIISNYHKLAGWADTLGGPIRSVVFDECQEVRIPDSAKYKAAKHISEGADYCLGLSGTPIYNNGVEFHSVMDVIHPGALGTRGEFVNEWAHGTAGRESIDDPKAFGLHVRETGLMIRRTRADVGRELPPVTRVPHHVDCDLEALDKVSNACRELALFILGRGASPLKRKEGDQQKGEMMQASEELSNKLRQATGIAKAPYVAEFVRMLVEQGEKVLLMGWHRAVYDLWNDRLKDVPRVMFTGTESPTQKEAAKQAFIRGDAKVMIMSLRAGAGIDGLQRVCRTICFGELDWAYGVMEQNITRLDRDQQPRQVVAYYLLSQFGIDPIMTDILNLKGAQLEGIRNPKHALVEALQGDPQKIKKLAEAYLAQQNVRT